MGKYRLKSELIFDFFFIQHLNSTFAAQNSTNQLHLSAIATVGPWTFMNECTNDSKLNEKNHFNLVKTRCI